MTLTASRTTAGFEFAYNIAGMTDDGTDGLNYVLTPNTAFSKGDMVYVNPATGKVAKCAANATNVLGVMAQDVSTADNTATSEYRALIQTNPLNVYRCSFADHTDGTASGGTTTSIQDAGVLTAADNAYIGCYGYIYDGTGAGNEFIVSDSVNVDASVVFAKPLPAAADTTTSYILLGVGTANVNIFPGAVGVDLKDENTIDANATITGEAGPLTCIKILPKDLMMLVKITKHALSH